MKSSNYYYFLLLLCLSIISCNETPKQDEELKGKLSTSLVTNPRSMDSTGIENLQDIASMSFVDTLHDFGRMKEGEMVVYEFSFINKGKKDLLINEAKGSCGCTVPEYPKEPIKPGEQRSIKVTFNSQGKIGYNEKTVMVITNGNPSILNLTILAEVY
jgi:hypothetical protein